MTRRDVLLPLEEIFTNADVNRNIATDGNNGYIFNYPPQWLHNDSNEKTVGVRRLKIIPTSHVFDLCFRLYHRQTATRI